MINCGIRIRKIENLYRVRTYCAALFKIVEYLYAGLFSLYSKIPYRSINGV